MKKYIQPSIEVVELEVNQVIATSIAILDSTTDQQEISRRRGDSWSER
jgi:hypothetical protein